MSHEYSDEQVRILRILVEMIIPASEAHGLPGAGDDAIFNDILLTAQRQHGAVSGALNDLHSLDSLGNLDEQAREDVVAAFRQTHVKAADTIAAITVQCYYRDDRVMRSLAMETRPPFPQGFEIAEGDWSLLEPVRGRPAIYRKTT